VARIRIPGGKVMVSVLRAHPPKKGVCRIVSYSQPWPELKVFELDRVYGGMCCWRKMAEKQVQDGSTKYEAKLDEYSSEPGRLLP
jgi:hypothetical protein